MKIVYCTNLIDSIGGLEKITIDKANALSLIEGNEVYIIVTFNRNKCPFTINNQVKILNLDVRYFDCYSHNPLKWIPFYLKKKKEHQKKLYKVLMSISPDVVISTGSFPLNSVLPKFKLSPRPIFIREIHSLTHYQLLLTKGLPKLYAYWRDFKGLNLDIRKFDKIIVLTQEDKENNWARNPKVMAIPNMITKKPVILSSLNYKKAIAVGRLVREKNFQSLISAWKNVKQKYPNWILEIYGDGYLRHDLQKQIEEDQLTEQVKLCGFSLDVTDKMSASSMLISTSLCEGFGLVLLEAMSCGLPVISYDYSCGPKDLIDDGENGFIVPLNNENKLSERICELIGNEQLRKRMGKAGVIKSRDYSQEIIIEKWMDLFKNR